LDGIEAEIQYSVPRCLGKGAAIKQKTGKGGGTKNQMSRESENSKTGIAK